MQLHGDDKETKAKAKANKLSGESSPYLLQHAHNPVMWYPWGEESLQRSRSAVSYTHLTLPTICSV